MKKSIAIAVAAIVGVAGVAETTPRVSAAEAQAPRSLDQVRDNALAAMNAGELQQVDRRGRRGVRSRSWRGGKSYRGGRNWGGRSYGYRRGYGGRRYGRDRRNYRGAAVAAGIAGLAIGAMAAGSARSSGHRTKQWCANRYRSYDWKSGTYLGNSGRRYACP